MSAFLEQQLQQSDETKQKQLDNVLRRYKHISKTNPLLPVKMLWNVISNALHNLHRDVYLKTLNIKWKGDDDDKGLYTSTTWYDALFEEEFEKILNEQIEEYENNQPEHFQFTPSNLGGKRKTKRNKIKRKNKISRKKI
jgi:hypothetical protein